MTGKFTLTEFQESVVSKFLASDAPGGIMGLGTGVGKTACATSIIERSKAERVLIMAPQSTFDSWASTVYWITGKKLRRAANNALTFSFTPDPTKRDEVQMVKLSAATCKKNLQDAQAGLPGFYFVTRELFALQTWSKVPVKSGGIPVIDPKTKKPKMRAQRKDVWSNNKPFDIAIVDEVQRFANRGNRGQQSWAALKARKKYALSADWFGSDLENMYTVACDIFGTEVLGLNKAQFKDDFLVTEFDPFSWDKKKVVGEQIPGLFAASLPLYVTAPPSVTPPEPEIRHITLSKAERELYDQLENNYVAMFGEEVLAVEIPLVLRIRLRELSLGVFRVVRTGEVSEDGIEKTTIEFPEGAQSTKLDEVKSIMADHPGEKFMIYSHSAKWCEFAAKELGVRAYTGNQTHAQRAQIKDDYIRGDLRAIVATVGAIGTGTDGLQAAGHRVIFASRDDKAKDNIQAIDRVARTGQKNQVEVIDLQARGTYDSGQLLALRRRVRTNDQAKGWD